ncbi:hypothetical protein MUN35_10720 [Hafnia paralvei]|uniref:hypothetical protein n=1 Tax=Hafnia paralvei TaxID=546367 RepID=UPI001FFFAB14|nr:hypothetical protein [Hafnia paralvei]MCK2180173.1 hypothetical protein [Hafnia paralvei]
MNANQLTKIPVEKLSDTLQFLIVENEIPLSDALKQVIDDVDAVCKKLLRDESAPAQPVIPEQANILGYFSFDPEDGAEILKDRQTAIDNCNASIDLYRESMQEEYPDGWSDDVKRVCWGVILQEARGFDAQGIPENDPNHTYQTLDYRLYPDSTNTVTAQPVSNPYKFLGERAKYRVIIEGFSNSRTVDFEACSQEEAEEIGRDIFHEECNYGVERLESIPAQESE